MFSPLDPWYGKAGSEPSADKEIPRIVLMTSFAAHALDKEVLWERNCTSAIFPFPQRRIR